MTRARIIRARLPILLLAAAVAISGCQGDEILPGERIPVRTDPVPEAGAARALAIPPAVANAEWTHRNGTSGGRFTNVALRPVPQLVWTANLGLGDGTRRRLMTPPVVAGGLVFAMDASAQLSAFTRDGGLVWRRSLVPAKQIPDAGPGGGIAVSGGTLYVTTGFGEVFALQPATGNTLWQKSFEAPIRAAPAVQDGRVLIAVRSDDGYALDARDGSVLWRVQGTGGPGLLGGASPATDGFLAVMPFASGEVLGVLARNGIVVWGTAVTGGRRQFARSNITDITGDPVIDGGTVYASNQAGRTVRIDAETGERVWTMPEGSYGPAWPVGGSIFLLSDLGALVRADAATGDLIWTVQLPDYFPRRGIFGPREPTTAINHFGPILAGGRLWVASADGLLRAFSPVDGTKLAEVALPGGAAAAPAVAGGVLYVPTRDGRLLAFQ